MIYEIIELSLYLSRNRNIESKIRMESTFIPSIKYSINVYHLLWRENRIKSEMEIKLRPNFGFNLSLHSHNGTGFWTPDKPGKCEGFV